jgi:hypothetical protein
MRIRLLRQPRKSTQHSSHFAEASKIHYVSAFDMAAVFASMGEKDDAFHWLEKAYSERESQMAFLGITRRMNGVRSDPRYSDLLHRMHLNSPIASN